MRRGQTWPEPQDWRARPEGRLDDGCTVHLSPTTSQTPELMQSAVASFNAGDLGAFAELLEPDVVMCPDPSWPEQGPFRGREESLSFVADWIAPWESVELAVDDQVERGEWVVARCRWLATGKASGAATEVPFTFLIQVREGRIATINAFFDHAEALRSLP